MHYHAAEKVDRIPSNVMFSVARDVTPQIKKMMRAHEDLKLEHEKSEI